MAIEDVKGNKSTKRDVLVRLEHARNISRSLADIGGGQYTVDYPFLPATVKQNGVDLAYTYVGTTLTVTPIETIGPIGLQPTYNPVIVTTFIYLTNSFSKYLDKDDPTGTINNVVEWKPILSSLPTTSQSVGNLLEGQLSFSTSGVKCTNQDRFFDDYLTIEDSFYNRSVSIWFGIDDNYQKAFEGKNSKPNVNNSYIQFSVKDGLKTLNDQALMGDNASEVILTSSSFPSIVPSFEGSISPYYIGLQTYDLQDWYDGFGYSGRTPTRESVRRLPVINVSANDGAGNVFATLDLGRLGYQPVMTNRSGFTILTQSTIVDRGKTLQNVRFNQSTKDLVQGNFLEFTGSGDGFTSRASIWAISYKTNNVLLDFHKALDSGKSISRTSPFSLFSFDTTGVSSTIMNPKDTMQSPGESFSASLTSGGNYHCTYVMWMKEADIETTEFYALWAPDPLGQNLVLTHAEAIKTICEKAGLDTNTASFDQADIDLVGDCRLEIPSLDESNLGNYYQYIQKLLQSSFGVVGFNPDGEVEYKVIKTIISPSIIITDTDIIRDSLSVSNEFQDIKTDFSIKPIGPGNYGFQFASLSGESQESLQLNSIRDSIDIQYLLDTDYYDYIYRGFEFARKPRIEYRFSTTMNFFDIKIGDEITVKSREVRNGSVDLLVTGFKKDINKINISATEIVI